ncbi:ABC transporter ATP-binding protein [Clostridium gasigenes]|uniref:ABC transporter ATP-binding protein n=1 Tax=Clostridium gasigenes TaxID=94869 RepID=UPI00143867DA|nr:ABC transporter ATP-binding protein [Clostridium gasigenes]MBU3131258.1 ABC transporter ATP-binding protein/permease [Clostridium gasigenes]NKF08141.1 ABC transporter ATP-binding protein [Clostridium gasigenes]QSW18507.1 ABC transporter ATP-binding protein [Clostridium gasigenes]
MFRVLKYVLRHKVSLIIGSLSMILIIGIDLCVPYLQKIFLDEGITGGDTTVIIPIIVAFLLISIVKAILGYLKEYLYDITSSEVHAELKKDIFNHIQGLEFKYFDEMNTGELMTRIGEDAENIWQTIGFGLRLFVENILYFVLSTVILFYLNWKLALACVVIMIPIGFIAIKLEKKFGECYGKISDKTAEINTTAQENIAGVRLVKAFAREKHEVTKFLKMNRSYYDLNIQQAKIVGKYFPPIEFLTNISLVIMIILGGYFVINEEITLGVLVAFSGYIWNLIWPMRMLGYLTDILSRNSASAKKIFAIIDRESKVVSKKDGYEPKSIKGEIEFKNVTFKYNDIDVLKDINLIVPSGSTVAIMGTTGSGKSTLINLIGRYYDVYKGEVLVDKVNVKDYNLNMLRSHMAIVPQDTFLFSDSIINNIKFSSDKASEEDVINICRAACCLDFIENLEEGFNSEIGERGLGLSGGQKQRIAIARALLRDASLLILDDSTSALDTETEQVLLTNLNNREKNCTTFIIAHRISAVKNADIIIYIEDGQIKEKGNHKELLQKKGAYYDIYCEQFKDFETIEKEVI